MATLPVMNLGVQMDILTESTSGAGTSTRDFIIQSDAVLGTLSADSVSGSLDVSVYGVVGDEETLLFSFPSLTAPVDLILKRSGPTVTHIRVRAVYDSPCSYKFQAKAINSGSSDSKILGASGWKVSQSTVGTSSTLLIPSAFTDRAGLVVKNWSVTQTVYLGESMGSASIASGYPLAPRDALAVDLAAGAELWAISDLAGADIRIAENGG